MAVLAPLDGVRRRWLDSSDEVSHRVADECRILQAVLADKVGHIASHGQVVVAWVVGGFAMVTQILREFEQE
jgi:hypothetical protein